tara:strand:- start:42 stop:569 length:528 start_codon:yes stop_codon:yes gene_type:complete
MKKTFLYAVLFVSASSYGQVGKVISSSLSLESGNVGPEKEIKFTYQSHTSETTEYSIAFFDSFSSTSGGEFLEIWGHGRTTLSVFSEPKKEYSKEELTVIIERIRSNYKHFTTQVKSKGRLFIHSDINLDDSWVFSAYMDFKTPKYAFWYHGDKYPIAEKDLVLMLTKFELYFNL